MPILQHPATPRNRGRRIVAQERRWRDRAPSVTLLEDVQAVPLLALDTETLHPKVLLERSPTTKPDHERGGISPNASGCGDRPAFDHGAVTDDRQFVGEVGDRASVDRYDL
jgi:hypothetical protein